jgi:hypothetical protein
MQRLVVAIGSIFDRRKTESAFLVEDMQRQLRDWAVPSDALKIEPVLDAHGVFRVRGR